MSELRMATRRTSGALAMEPALDERPVPAPGDGASDSVRPPRPRSSPDATNDFLRTLHEEHGSAVLAFATGITKDRLLAEDVVQETMIRAWKYMDTLDPTKGRIRSWLFRVAHNIAIDKFRARQYRPAEVAEVTSDSAVCGDHSDAVVLAAGVRHALSQLSTQHAVVLEQCYFHDLTSAQAAQVLGIPVGTVKSRLFYGLRALRELMDQSLGENIDR